MPSPRTVSVGKLTIANDRPFTLIAGPCALESAPMRTRCARP